MITAREAKIQRIFTRFQVADHFEVGQAIGFHILWRFVFSAALTAIAHAIGIDRGQSHLNLDFVSFFLLLTLYKLLQIGFLLHFGIFPLANIADDIFDFFL